MQTPVQVGRVGLEMLATFATSWDASGIALISIARLQISRLRHPPFLSADVMALDNSRSHGDAIASTFHFSGRRTWEPLRQLPARSVEVDESF